MSDSKIESAKTGRSKCRKCREAIEKATLRLGIISYQFDTDGSWGWYHLNCGAAFNPQAFEAAVSDYEGPIPDLDALREKAKKEARKSIIPRIEPAPSARALCLGCGEKIKPKGALRVVVEREVEEQPGIMRPRYMHIGCASEHEPCEGDLQAILLANSDLDAEQKQTFADEF